MRGGPRPAHARPETGAWPRALALVVLGFLFTVLSTTLFSWWAVGPLRLSPVVVVAVSASFQLPLPLGGAVVLFLGYLADLLSGGVVGLQLTAYIFIFVVCALVRRQLAIDSIPFQMASVWVMTALSQSVVVAGLALLNRGPLVSGSLPWLVAAQATLSALTAPVFFWMIDLLAALIQKVWPSQNHG